LEDIGGGREVVDVCLCLCDEQIGAQLIRKAMKLGVGFTLDDLMELEGAIPDDLFHRTIHYAGFESEFSDDFSYSAPSDLPAKKHHTIGKAVGLGALIGLFAGLFGGKRKHSRTCNGDCANCPAHYGYRYGRWYYGHGHNHGCEFGGNNGGGGTD
jgi:hypothetical protein